MSADTLDRDLIIGLVEEKSVECCKLFDLGRDWLGVSSILESVCLLTGRYTFLSPSLGRFILRWELYVSMEGGL